MKNTFLLFGLLLLLTLSSCTDNDDLATTEVYPENLLAYYPFSDNALNEVSLDHNGIVEGAILASDIGNYESSAFLFDGVDDVIEIAHSEELNLSNDFTISALVKPEEIKTQTIIRKGTNTNGTGSWPYGVSFSGTGEIVFSLTTENGETLNQVRKQGYEIGEWLLITGVFKDSKMFLYVNGELEGFEIIDGEKNTNSSPLLIGSRLGLPSDTFKGIIDEVRIYTSGLSESEVIELYNSLWF
ncbi:LamG domain-containing protein [uncultured Winogradskyella sp.]|uniref:LamG domain-containing protein n=1 Tax=uncultured Winogradskyella sp. TaxID=395353 RepID=UPI00262C2CA9|nr:LamG domain-containing protein [uncultured Winogradskyella sp.]